MKEEINKAVEVLRAGGVILYPTDTVWGLGCDATNPEAVKKIFEIKKREESKSMIVLLENENNLNRYLKDVPAIAWELIEATDKPLTLVYPGAKNLAANLIAEDGSIAIRVTKDEFCKGLIMKLGKPLVSTSANISGNSTPAQFSEIDLEVLNAVDYTVNLNRNKKGDGKPSTIIQVQMNGEFKILRK